LSHGNAQYMMIVDGRQVENQQSGLEALGEARFWISRDKPSPSRDGNCRYARCEDLHNLSVHMNEVHMTIEMGLSYRQAIIERYRS
jgi:hypothetical protein